MKVKRIELLKALKAVMPGAAKDNPLLVGSDSFVFKGDIIQSYNDHLSVTYPFNIGVHGAVKALELVKVLEKMPEDEIQLTEEPDLIWVRRELETGESTEMSHRKIKYETATLLESLNLEELNWHPIPKNLVRAFQLCLPTVSRNTSYGGLIGIHVNGDDVMSSDNFRSTWVTLESPVTEAFTIPGTSVGDLLKLEGLEQYSVTESWGHFMSKEGAVFSSRLIASEFPYKPLKNMFPKSGGDPYSFPKGMEKALERASILSHYQDDGIDYITLEEKRGYLVITGERHFASIREKVKLAGAKWPEGMSLSIQPSYLIDIISKTRKFEMFGNLAHFHGGDFRHIVSTIIPSQ